MSPVTGSAKLLRAMNASATLAHLLQAGELTRAELRQRTGLSKPTASEMLRLLTDAGLAVVSGRTAGAVGPTAEIYAPNGDAAYTVALSVRDTLGTERPSLGTALCDLNGTIRMRTERSIDFSATTPAEAVVDALAEVCRGAGADASRIRHLQIGFPGAYDTRTDTLHQAAVPGWARPGVLGEIAAAVGLPAGARVALDNDVKLAAIAERHRGVATTADSFCLLWLGAGVGLATDLGGVLLRGSRGGAGEIGYLPVCAGHPTGPTGGGADLQDLIGGPAVLALAAEFGIDAASPAEAMRAAVADDVAPVVERLAERIAFAMATVIAVLDPPLVVLAGEVAQAGGARLRDAVAAAVHPSTPAPFPGLTEGDVEIAVTAVDDDAVLLGGLDAGRTALHESLISSLAQPSTD
jgi:predicted NBD/HSP70 family sugar kinase